MKQNIAFVSLLILLTIIFSSCTSQRDDFSLLKGPYVGQKPPGIIPEIFAQGIVSTGASEFGSTFTPGGQEFCYAVSGVPRQVIVFIKFQAGRWNQPQIPDFSGRYDDWDMNYSPDGKKLYFTSNRPFTGTGNPLDNSNLWVVEKTDIGWGKPRDLGPLINTNGYENYPSVTKDETLFYFHSKKGNDQNPDVYYSKLINGKYSEPGRLGEEINSQYQEWDPFIAQDESYLIFGSVDRPGGFGGCDLYISFRKDDGTWTQAVNMGEPINTEANEFCPNVTSDGKYLFFTSRRRRLEGLHPTDPITYKEKMNMVNSPGNGEGDIYWVNAQVIYELKPDELK